MTISEATKIIRDKMNHEPQKTFGVRCRDWGNEEFCYAAVWDECYDECFEKGRGEKADFWLWDLECDEWVVVLCEFDEKKGYYRCVGEFDENGVLKMRQFRLLNIKRKEFETMNFLLFYML